MNKIINVILFAFMLLFTACEHRELLDPNTGHYIRIYLDEEIKNVTCGFYDETLNRPEYFPPKAMRVLVTDPITDVVITERYLQNLGEDERGHYFDGYISIPEGEYNLVAYSFGSSVSLIRNENSFYTMEAYTSPLNDYYLQYIPSSRIELENGRIVYAPEHIFHDVAESILIKPSAQIDTLRASNGDYFCAHSMVKSYYLQVRVSGFEWIKTAVSLLGGMAGSTLVSGHNAIESAEPVQIFFPMDYKDKQTSRDATTATLYTTFNTFGKLPNTESIYTISFEFVRGDGTSQVEEFDITSLFNTPMGRENQWLLIDKEIVISPSEIGAGGGMVPGVEGWKDVEGDIQM